jgi:hypothetical protein
MHLVIFFPMQLSSTAFLAASTSGSSGIVLNQSLWLLSMEFSRVAFLLLLQPRYSLRFFCCCTVTCEHGFKSHPLILLSLCSKQRLWFFTFQIGLWSKRLFLPPYRFLAHGVSRTSSKFLSLLLVDDVVKMRNFEKKHPKIQDFYLFST